jgi:energy-coupling factor transport system substrate-specific component
MNRALTLLTYGLSALIGIAAFTYPFFLPHLAQVGQGEARASVLRLADAPLLTTLLVVLCLGTLLLEIQGQAVNAKLVAALGVLVAITSILRFLEVAIPGPGGLSLMFAPILLSGYVFGGRFGFLMGTMALLVSALITGGVGPWLPYQMFTAGWIGLTAGWLPVFKNQKITILMLTAVGFGWGLLFGAIMNLYFWPFLSDGGSTGWQPGSGIGDTLARYSLFYASTSLIWDLARAIGNAALVLVLGMPAVRALVRFRNRFQFQVV